MKKLVAVDIGLGLTKIAVARLDKGSLEILSLDYFKTPYRNKQKIEEKAFFDQVYKVVPEEELKSAELAVSISPAEINFAIFSLAKMPKSELDLVCEREAKRRIIPTPLQDDLVNYVVLSENKMPDSVSFGILATSAKKEAVYTYLNLFQSQKINPCRISTTPVNLLTYFRQSAFDKSKNWAFIDIGFKNTTVLAFNKKNLALIRDIAFGISDFIEAVAGKRNIEFSKAQELFLADTADDEVIIESWNYLLSEMRRSFAFYKESQKNQNIESLHFSGGLLSLKSTQRILKENIGGSLTLFKFEKAVLPGLFCNCLGSLFSFISKEPVLNFLPKEVLQERTKKKIKFFSLQALLVISAILGFIVFSLFTRAVFLKASLSKLKNNFPHQEYQRVTSQASAINLRLQNIQKQKDQIANIQKYNLPWREIFSLISESIPADAFLKDFEINLEAKDKAKGSQAMPELGGQSGGGFDVFGGSGGAESNQGKIRLTLKGAIVATFEEARRLLEGFRQDLDNSELLYAVELGAIRLEEIVVKSTLTGKKLAAASEQEKLTKIIEREFSITANINLKTDEKDSF